MVLLDRIACQDATAQMALLQFMQARGSIRQFGHHHEARPFNPTCDQKQQ